MLSYGEGIVQTTNAPGGSKSCSGKLSRWSHVRVVPGSPIRKRKLPVKGACVFCYLRLINER